MKVQFYIQPNSSENKIVGFHDQAIKIKIKAPPVDGKANKEIIDYLSDVLNISKKQIEILHGETGRMKLIEFHVSEEEKILIKKKLKLPH